MGRSRTHVVDTIDDGLGGGAVQRQRRQPSQQRRLLPAPLSQSSQHFAVLKSRRASGPPARRHLTSDG